MYDQNIADRLWAAALKQIESKQHQKAIYSSYDRWEKLRPDNIPFLKWMSANVYQHTGEPKMQEKYMQKLHLLMCKSANEPKIDRIVSEIKWMMFRIEHSLNDSIQSYLQCKLSLNCAIDEWVNYRKMTSTEKSLKCQNMIPLPIFHAMMILEPTSLDRYLNCVYQCFDLPNTSFDLSRNISRKIGFLWLSITTDPSYKCLKAFVKMLNRFEDICIYLDDVDVPTDIQSSLAPVTYKCVKTKTDDEVAQMIYDDGIKILINNFWDRARGFRVFALRPCPVTINFMGVPGRYLNSNIVQYSVTDEVMHDEFAQMQLPHSEKSLVLPQYYQIASALTGYQTRERTSLKRIGIFARPLKISAREMFVCREILKRYTDITLILICSETDLPRVTETAIDNDILPQYFARVSTAFQSRDERYFNVLNSLDLCIDTFSHFGALSTGIEVLSTGCPLISIPGNTLFSCHSQSLLKSVRVDDTLLCRNEQDMIYRIGSFIADQQQYIEICKRIERGFKNSKINDLDYRSRQFSEMLKLVENDYDRGRYEDIHVKF